MTGVYSFYLLQGDLRGRAADRRGSSVLGRGRHADVPRPRTRSASAFSASSRATTPGARRPAGARPRAVPDGSRPTPARREQNWLLPFDPLVIALSHLATVLVDHRPPREASEAADRAMARAATLPFPEGPFSMAYAKSYLAWMYAIGGTTRPPPGFAGEVREIGRRHGFVFWESTGEIHLALAEYRHRRATGRRRHGRAARRDLGVAPGPRLPALCADGGRGDQRGAGHERRGGGRLRRGRDAGRGDRRRGSTRPSACACWPRTGLPGTESRAMLRQAWELAHRPGRAAVRAAGRAGSRPVRSRIRESRGAPGRRSSPCSRRGRLSRAQRGTGAARAAPTRRHDGAAAGAGPRRRHGRPGRGLAALGARLAGAVLLDHGAGTRLPPRRQGSVEPGRARSGRGARPPRLARPLRQRLPGYARVLRGAGPGADRPFLPDPQLARRLPSDRRARAVRPRTPTAGRRGWPGSRPTGSCPASRTRTAAPPRSPSC